MVLVTVACQEKKSEKIMKIVAYGCQTPSAQRRSDQFCAFCPTPLDTGIRMLVVVMVDPVDGATMFLLGS